jgi:xanthine dehydrogenase YagT iron-sulfur-binding subunit
MRCGAFVICVRRVSTPKLRAMRTHQPPSAFRRLQLQVNTQPVVLTVPVSTTLAELLRDRLQLRGTKVACNQAACGACTVLVDGAAVFACHTLAAQCEGTQVQTVEGLGQSHGDGEALHPLQQAFIDHDAQQCGFCTPGMLMALKGALDAGVAPERDALAQAISGSICRCGAYEHILEAALDVASSRR